MKIAVLKETRVGENRVAITPQVAKSLIQMGNEVLIEAGAGLGSHFSDDLYKEAGAQVVDRSAMKDAAMYVQINMPESTDAKLLAKGSLWVSLMYHRSNPELISAFNAEGLSVLSLDAIPRISRAQSMDVVIEGAYHLDKIFPMLMTAAGTVTPAKVLIFGVGVAGLQAIATAKRLGSVVEATDVRPETKEQVQSLGGKFIEVKGVEVGSEGGYAKEATEEYRAAQREAVNKSLAQADLVITTALVPGRKAPILVDDEQLGLMKSGSVLIDMAAEQGGNCSQTEAGKVKVVGGVKLVGAVNMPSELSANASELFARNIWELLKLIAPKGELILDRNDEIVQGCLICSNGEIYHNA
ncbi:MAG: NAD(P) transhydrogenase subunit alpha [Bacteroidetes bacterium]|nr:NAD(P) transhydrogenase subunit alpha [Bacteroidota bacterium]